MRLFLIEAKSVYKLKRTFVPDVTLEGAARLLGLTRANVLRLVENGLIIPVSAPSIDSRNHWKFEPSALEQFLNRVCSKIQRLRNRRPNDLQAFSSVLASVNEKLSPLGYGIHTLIDDILSGRIVPRGESSEQVGVSRLLFSPAEVESYVGTRGDGQNNERVEVKALSDRFQLKPEILWLLVAKGLINTTAKTHNGVRYKTITARAVLAFKAEYVLDAELARQVGARTDDLRKQLARMGVKPISGGSVDYGPKYVFRWSDINRLNLKKIGQSCRQRKQRLMERNSVEVVEAAQILSVPPQTIIDLVRNDVLKPYSDSACSGADYRFNRSYIEYYKGQFRNPANLITKRVAGRILGKYNLHYRWLAMGHLKYVISKDGERRFLNRKAVETIASAMATLARIIHEWPSEEQVGWV